MESEDRPIINKIIFFRSPTLYGQNFVDTDHHTYMNLLDIPFQRHMYWYGVILPCAAKTASTLLGRVPQDFGVYVWECVQIQELMLYRKNWLGVLIHSKWVKEVRALCSSFEFLHAKLIIPCFLELAFCIILLEQKMAFYKVRSTQISEKYLYVVALTVPFIGKSLN